MYWHDGMGFGGWWVMGIGMLILWAMVITAIVLLVRWATIGRSQEAPQSAAGEQATVNGSRHRAQGILDERFARGEIDVEEYRLRRDVLYRG